jgi:hypothetical protein
MATKTLRKSQAVKPVEKKPATAIERVLALIAKQSEAVEAIIAEYSYITDIGMDTELKAAVDNLRESVQGYEDDFEPEGFSDLLQKIKDHAGFDADEVFEMLDIEDISHDNCVNILNSLDKEDIESWAVESGYACVKINNALDRDKLETFLTTEIYPNYLDQQSFLMI